MLQDLFVANVLILTLRTLANFEENLTLIRCFTPEKEPEIECYFSLVEPIKV
jgi:hypothetical protein